MKPKPRRQSNRAGGNYGDTHGYVTEAVCVKKILSGGGLE
jgi:hypothetical protein